MRSHAKASSAGSTEGNGSLRLTPIVFCLALLASLTFGAAIAAAAPPVPTPQPASEIGYSSALLKGDVDPGGQETSCRFDFISDARFEENVGNGLSGFEGAGQIGCTEAFSGNGAQSITPLTLTGLSANTTYHLRFVAANGEGEVATTAPDFITKEIVNAPTTAIDAPGEVKYTTAHISGAVNPHGGNENLVGGAVPIKWELQYSANPGLGWSLGGEGTLEEAEALSSSAIAVQANLTSLQTNTEYKYRLVASSAGKVAISPEGSFETEEVSKPTVEANDATLVTGTTAHFSGHVTAGGTDPVFKSSCAFDYVTEAEFQPHNEQQQVFVGATGGTFALTFIVPVSGAQQTTAPVAFNASAATVQAALQALPGIGSGNASVSGGPGDEKAAHPYTIVFSGSLANTNIEALIVDGSLLTPPGTPSAPNTKVRTVRQGNQGFGGAQSIACEPSSVTGTSPLEVTADAGNLEPDTVYHLRLRAENVGGIATDDATNTFLTEPTAPIISATAAHEIATTTATLNAQINPRGAATTYHFEYLTLGEFEVAGEEFTGATVTPESESIGTDNENHLAGALLEGLEPDTGYRFRAIANNLKSPSGGTIGPVGSFRTESSAPDSCHNAEVRTQQGSGYLPDCRAYEQVSPSSGKFGNDAGAPGNQVSYSVATADGNGVLYGSHGPMGKVTRGLQPYTISRRQADGTWRAESAFPADAPEQIFGLSQQMFSLLPSADLSKLVFAAPGSFVPDNPVTGFGNASAGLYRSNLDGSIEWLSRPQTPNPKPAPGSYGAFSWFEPVGASPDLSTVYFSAGPTLLPEDAERAPSYDPGDPNTRAWGLYEYSNGVLKSAGTLPDGSESPGGAAPAATVQGGRGGISNTTDPAAAANQVSQDGSTLFFVSPDPGPAAGEPKTELYVRRGGHSTLVSHAQDGTAAPSGVVPVPSLNYWETSYPRQYVYGSKDGKTAIFQSVDALVSGAPGDSSIKTYRYDVETNTVSYLPGVGGTVVAASDDGSRFLFGGTGQYGPAGIFLWDEGSIKTVYSGSTSSGGLGGLTSGRATASGSVFVFASSAPIPGFNNRPAVIDGADKAQIYRYDVAKEKLNCLSCPPDDITPLGASHLTTNDTPEHLPSGELTPNRGISEDGNRVFFSTPAPLVPRDTNGRTTDVYEWTPTRISLISSGKSPESSYFLDNSADGKDVFFATREGLDFADTDGAFDVYDAHVDGGFLRKEVTPCSGEECRSSASVPTGAVTAATKSFSGAGNNGGNGKSRLPSVPKVKVGARRVVGENLKLAVTVPSGGKVSVIGSGIDATSHTYSKAGTYQLEIPLSSAAKSSLGGKQPLKLKVHLRFKPKSGKPSSVNFVLTVKA